MFFLKQLKLVIVFRADLKLSKGKTASQAAHAAVICFKKTCDSNSSLAEKWLKVGQPKIVLKVDSLADLENLQRLAEEAGVQSGMVCDAGRTQISSGTATCLGIGPDYDGKIDALVKDLKLL